MTTRYDEFKGTLSAGEKRFIEDYEIPINDFFEDLNNRHLLKTNITPDELKNIQRFVTTSNASLKLFNSFNKIFLVDSSTELESNLNKLNEAGLELELDQYGSVLCHTYQVISEQLKLNMVNFVLFDSFGLNNAGKKPLGLIIQKLKDNCPQNKFIDYLNTEIRNAVTHYSYYFENGKLYLCNGFLDNNPKEMELHEFMTETKNMNLITTSFVHIFLDKYS